MSEEAELHTTTAADTDGRNAVQPRSRPSSSRAISRELLDHVGWPSAAIAGCSMGGCVAMAIRGACSRLESGLSASSTRPAWYGEQAPGAVARPCGGRAREGVCPRLVDFQIERWFSDGFRRATIRTLVARARGRLVANDLDCYAASCALLGDADLRAYLHAVGCPSQSWLATRD